MRALLRCDADRATGTGHVMRCFALAEELTRRQHEVVWLGRIEGVPWLEALMRETDQRVIPVPDLASQLDGAVRSFDPDWIVIDSYDARVAVPEFRRRGRQVAAIVDDATPTYPADLHISPGISRRWRPEKVEGELLHGPDYVLVRAQVRRMRCERRAIDTASGPGLLAILGGSDAAGLGPILSRLALGGHLPTTLHLVSADPRLGGAACCNQNTRGGADPRLVLHEPGETPLRLATRADLAITPAGVTSWELLFLGTPVGLILAAGNQRPNYSAMTDAMWASRLGTASEIRADPPAFARRVDALLHDQGALREAASRAQLAVDGCGAERICDRLEQLI